MTSPTPMEVKTVVWIEGRDGKAITWDLGKIGILSNTAKQTPSIGERWAVRVIRDTAPGERRGVLVLEPVKRLSNDEPSVEMAPPLDPSSKEVSENVDSLVTLAAVCLCPTAEVKVSRTAGDRTVRYLITSPDDVTSLIGLDGKVVESLRTLVRHIMAQAGMRAWLDIGGAVPYAICDSCGRSYSDMLEYEDGTSPGGAEDRFENDRPTRYAYRFCVCGARVYTDVYSKVA